jgi:hypothetical protein
MSTTPSRWFHVSTGGVTFAVENNGSGPEVVVYVDHARHETGFTRVAVPRVAFGALVAMFAEVTAVEAPTPLAHVCTIRCTGLGAIKCDRARSGVTVQGGGGTTDSVIGCGSVSASLRGGWRYADEQGRDAGQCTRAAHHEGDHAFPMKDAP